MDSSNKIQVVPIDEEELNTSAEVTKLSEIYWKDYLEDRGIKS